MGYTTSFDGEFHLDPPDRVTQDDLDAAIVSGIKPPRPNQWVTGTRQLTNKERSTLVRLRGYASADQVVGAPCPLGHQHHKSEACMLGVEVFVPDLDYMPDSWCQWEIHDGRLVWDEGDKFYHYIEWLCWLIRNVFDPRGVGLDGEVTWYGEDFDDRGKIRVFGARPERNQVQVGLPKIEYQWEGVDARTFVYD